MAVLNSTQFRSPCPRGARAARAPQGELVRGRTTLRTRSFFTVGTYLGGATSPPSGTTAFRRAGVSGAPTGALAPFEHTLCHPPFLALRLHSGAGRVHATHIECAHLAHVRVEQGAVLAWNLPGHPASRSSAPAAGEDCAPIRTRLLAPRTSSLSPTHTEHHARSFDSPRCFPVYP